MLEIYFEKRLFHCAFRFICKTIFHFKADLSIMLSNTNVLNGSTYLYVRIMIKC